MLVANTNFTVTFNIAKLPAGGSTTITEVDVIWQKPDGLTAVVETPTSFTLPTTSAAGIATYLVTSPVAGLHTFTLVNSTGNLDGTTGALSSYKVLGKILANVVSIDTVIATNITLSY